MDEWIVGMAEALGEQPVSPQEMGAVLKLAREVAHGVERKLAPVSTYLAGVYAGREAALGIGRDDALERAVETALSLIPKEQGGEGPVGGSP